MALAHPPRPIRSRSRNKRQNMWVGWYVSSWWSWFWSVYSIHYYIHTTYYICILIEMIKINSFWRVGVVCMVCRMIRYCYPFLLGFECIFKSYSSRFAIIWYCSLVGCTLSEFIWLVLGACFSGVECHLVFLLPIPWMLLHHDGCDVCFFRPFYPFWSTHLGFLRLLSSGPATTHLRGCFCTWTFSLHIGLNMLPSDSFMSCLDYLLWKSTGEFQALIPGNG